MLSPSDHVTVVSGVRVQCAFVKLSSSSDSSYVQLSAEASFLRFVCVVAVFIRISVRPTLFHMFVPFNEIRC